MAKFADHLPLYRQEAIFGRAGLAMSAITQFDGLLVTIGDGQDGQEIHGQQNDTGIATGAVLELGG